MTDGIFLNSSRPRSKKEVKEAVAADPSKVRIECTSIFTGGYDGPLSEAPVGKTISFVGPDPYTKRTFYGFIKITEKDNERTYKVT